MNRLASVWMAVMVVIIFTPLESVLAQTPGKKPLPQVPITYSGDTDQTIIRRAQWLEGAKKERELVVWTSLLSPQAKNMAAEFNKIYPFITVTYHKPAPSEAPVKAEAEFASGRPSFDIVELGEFEVVPKWRKLGIPVKYLDLVPGGKKLDKRIYSKSGDWAAAGMNVFTPQYNTKQVSAAEAPKSWEDLLDPRWKGRRIGIQRTMQAWQGFVGAEDGWGLEKTETYLKKLRAQDLVVGGGGGGTHSLLIAGDFRINAVGYLTHVIRSQRQGAPVDWCRVNPVVAFGTPCVLSSKAPHPNAASLFIEWQFSPQGLLTYDKITDKGLPFPGMGTLQSQLVAGLDIIVGNEEAMLRIVGPAIRQTLENALGITPLEE